tara:strand:+ start:2779 stop:3033 length:255 start_codon:yes stop_codon:yes gene_type:complete
MDRVDTLIAELSSRHSNRNPRFLEAVRPIVVKIFDDRTPEESRVPLLEMLAETFARDVASRNSCEAAQHAWAAWIDAIKGLLRG